MRSLKENYIDDIIEKMDNTYFIKGNAIMSVDRDNKQYNFKFTSKTNERELGSVSLFDKGSGTLLLKSFNSEYKGIGYRTLFVEMISKFLKKLGYDTLNFYVYDLEYDIFKFMFELGAEKIDRVKLSDEESTLYSLKLK